MIKKEVMFLFVFLILLYNINLALAQEKTCVTYFYGIGCPHCENIKPLINELANNSDIELRQYEIYQNKENLALLNKFYDTYAKNEKKAIPVVFIKDKYILGDQKILSDIYNIIKQNEGAACQDLSKSEQNPLIILIIIFIVVFSLLALYYKIKSKDK